MKSDTLPFLSEKENPIIDKKLVIFFLRDLKAALICFSFGLPLFILTSWILQRYGFDSNIVFWSSTCLFTLVSTCFYYYLLDSDFFLYPYRSMGIGRGDTPGDFLGYSSGFSLKENDISESSFKIDEEINSNESHFSSKDMAQFYLKVGFQKIEVGLYEDAILDFNVALQKDSSLEDLILQCNGYALLKLQKYWDAIDSFSKALDLNKNSSYLALNNRGYAYAKLGKFDMAIENFRLALNIEPDYKEAKHNLEIASGHKSSNRRKT